jgi:hypothetical protein
VLRTHHIFFAALLGLVVGCGDSDGSADLYPASITAQNAEQFASQGVGAIELVESLSQMAQDFTGVFEGSAQSIPCDSGTVNVNIVDNLTQGQMDAGDSVSFNYSACTFDDLVLNGAMSMTCQEASGAAPGAFSYTVTVSYSNLTAASDGVTVSVNGGFTLTASSSDGVSVATTVSGTYLSAFASGAGQSFSGSLSNFSMQSSYDDATGDFSRSINAVVASSELGGSVTYETILPFTGNEPDYPDAGQLVVTGANGGSVTLTALNDTTVEIAIDLDGNTVPDITFQTQWAEIDDA